MYSFDSIPLGVTYLAPSTFQPKNPQEAIAANVELLMVQFEAGDTEGLTAYLLAMGRFRQYSFDNILEIGRQRPDATRVAGRSAWSKLGRKVMEGQKGIRILAPMSSNRTKKGGATDGSQDANSPARIGFRAAYVFDVSQTEGAELPGLRERTTGDADEYRGRLVDFVTRQGIRLEFSDSVDPELGISYGGRIALMPGQEPAEEFGTLVQELAHEMLRKAERKTATTRRERESEAEAIAFVVSQTTGVDAGRASADYIYLPEADASLLAESLEVIQRTSALILDAIETPPEPS